MYDNQDDIVLWDVEDPGSTQKTQVQILPLGNFSHKTSQMTLGQSASSSTQVVDQEELWITPLKQSEISLYFNAA